MKKISFPPGNAFCPACLYLYGTYREDGQPNYGLFTWAAYAWDEGLRFVACIGEDKLTRDRIRAQGVFSASVVSEALLPAADFCGNHAGYAVDKSRRIPSGRGAVLPVPVPEESPWTLEFQVEKTLRLDEAGRSEIYLCAIRNVLGDAALAEEGRPFAERVRAAGWSFLTATHDVNNPRSGAVMRKLGMRYAYSYREHWMPKDISVVYRMYQINLDGQDGRVDRTYWERFPEHFVEEGI